MKLHGSWRTTLWGSITMLMGGAVLAAIPSIVAVPALAPLAVPLGGVGMGLVSAGAQGIVGRDNKVSSEEAGAKPSNPKIIGRL